MEAVRLASQSSQGSVSRCLTSVSIHPSMTANSSWGSTHLFIIFPLKCGAVPFEAGPSRHLCPDCRLFQRINFLHWPAPALQRVCTLLNLTLNVPVHLRHEASCALPAPRLVREPVCFCHNTMAGKCSSAASELQCRRPRWTFEGLPCCPRSMHLTASYIWV